MRRLAAYLPGSILLGVFLLTTTVAQAAVQISDPLISVTPSAPQSYEQASVQLTDLGQVTPGSRVQWYVDDIERTADENRPSISVLTKGVGEATAIAAHITSPGGTTDTYTATIVPVRLDILISSNSYTPGFYQGRSLPSGSSAITARALVFGDINGPYTYRWRVNGEAKTTGIDLSSNVITFSPGLRNSVFIEIEVYDKNSTLVSQKTMTIPLAAQEVYFYEANPLRGVLPNVLKDPYYFLNDEITLRAEPYFFSADQENFAITWTIDGSKVSSDTHPLELSLIKTQEDGQATIGLKIINTADYLESAASVLQLNY